MIHQVVQTLYTFLVICFARYKEYIICMTSFSKFSDELPAFVCVRATGNLSSICLELNILSCVVKSERFTFCCFYWKY